MKRYICALTISLIIIILGLYNNEIALFEAKEKNYTNVYEATIEEKKFLLYIKKNESKLKIGDTIKFIGTYNEPNSARNEGGFDYKLYLKTKKIYGSFKVESYNTIKSKNTLIQQIKINFKKLIARLQNNIKNILEKNLKQENASLLEGLLIGQKSNIDERVIENFRNASLSHICAILCWPC